VLRVEILGFRVQGLEVGVNGSVFGDSSFRVQGSRRGFEVQGLGIRDY
jgi:hypothetical protein